MVVSKGYIRRSGVIRIQNESVVKGKVNRGIISKDHEHDDMA